MSGKTRKVEENKCMKILKRREVKRSKMKKDHRASILIFFYKEWFHEKIKEMSDRKL